MVPRVCRSFLGDILDYAPTGTKVDRTGRVDASQALANVVTAANTKTAAGEPRGGSPLCDRFPLGISGSGRAVDDDAFFLFGLRQSSFPTGQSHARRAGEGGFCTSERRSAAAGWTGGDPMPKRNVQNASECGRTCICPSGHSDNL